MDKALDMSLDDIIKSRKGSSRGKGRGRGIGSARGGRGAAGSVGSRRITSTGTALSRPGTLRVNVRPSVSTIAKSIRRSKNFPWRRDLLEDSMAASGLPRIETDAKLNISNLDQRVSNDDIRELFCEVGELKQYAIHYDKNGRPSGSAVVIYARRSDAFAAMRRYNNVKLDGRPMKIDFVCPEREIPVSARVNVIGGMNGRSSRKVVMTPGGIYNATSLPARRGVGQMARGRSRNSSGRGRGQGGGWGQGRGQGQGQGQPQGRGFKRVRGRGRGKNQSNAEQLDKELESYHAERGGMQT